MYIHIHTMETLWNNVAGTIKEEKKNIFTHICLKKTTTNNQNERGKNSRDIHNHCLKQNFWLREVCLKFVWRGWHCTQMQTPVHLDISPSISHPPSSKPNQKPSKKTDLQHLLASFATTDKENTILCQCSHTLQMQRATNRNLGHRELRKRSL